MKLENFCHFIWSKHSYCSFAVICGFA